MVRNDRHRLHCSPTAALLNHPNLRMIYRMPFQITTTRHFSAAHQLRLYDGSLEPLHGHNWKVRITVAAAALDSIGVVMDFHELERLVEDVIGKMHNRHLNDLPEFSRLNPSAENVALHIAQS